MNIKRIIYCLLLSYSTLTLFAQQQMERQSVSNVEALKEFSEKELKLRKLLKEQSEDNLLRTSLGNLYYKNKKFKDAHRQYQNAINNKSTVNKVDLYHNLGNAFLRAGKFDKAIEAYKNALYQKPDDDQTRHNLAVAKKMKKQNQKQDPKQDKQNKDNQPDQKNHEDKDKKQDQNNKKDQEKENKKEDQKKDDEQKQNQKPKEKKRQRTHKTNLTDQQIDNLLKAMEQEENKTLNKINKPKGQVHEMDKDW